MPTWIIMLSWAAFLSYWGVSALSVKRDVDRSWKRSWFTRVALIILVSWLVSHLAIGQKTFHPSFRFPASSGFWAYAGAVLCALGVALAIWARFHLGRNWSGRPTTKVDHELVTSGPYQIVRHPIYTGVILALLGVTLVYPFELIIFFLVCGMFLWRVKKEENLMEGQFGEKYREYKKRTRALIPFVW